FVELLEIFVEGLVPITAVEEFTGRRCQFRERDRAIVAMDGARESLGRHGGRARGGGGGRMEGGRSAVAALRGKDRLAQGARAPSFHLGDRVRVRAERIDHFTHRVEFALLEAEGETADEEKRKIENGR
ncbi:MAG: hypothetical protein ACRD5F_07535, partial [Candidatus Acidiferrales bacterium]